MPEPMSEERLAFLAEKHRAFPLDTSESPVMVCPGCLAGPCEVGELLAEVRRLRETAEVLWGTMNRDTKPYAAGNLHERGLPQIEDDWIPKDYL